MMLRIDEAATAVPGEYGGRVAILDYVAERSTTAVVKRIREGEEASPATWRELGLNHD